MGLSLRSRRLRPVLVTLGGASMLLVACGSPASTTIATPASTGFTPRGTEDTGTIAVDPTSLPVGGTSTAPGTSVVLGKPTVSNDSTISTVGLDKVHFGMTVAE